MERSLGIFEIETDFGGMTTRRIDYQLIFCNDRTP